MEIHGIEINQTFFIDGWALNKTTYGHFMFDENLELKTEEDVNTTQMVVLMIVCPEAIHTHLTTEMTENDIFSLLNPRPIAKEE